MTKEGRTMIFLPESIERILERIGEAYKRDIKKCRSYYSSISKNGKKYTGTDTVKIQLEYFEEFKTSLENGTNQLLVCEEGKEDEAKIRLMNAVLEWYEPLWAEDVCRVENDVYIQRGLRKRIERLKNECKTQKEALNLLGFLNNAYNSSWRQDDAHYKIKDFRLVESEEEFEKILNKFDNAEELTASKWNIVDYTTIRVVLVPMDRRTILIRKGLFEDYQRFYKEHLGDMNFDSAFKMFNLWHDVRETAIYYIYAPKVKK